MCVRCFTNKYISLVTTCTSHYCLNVNVYEINMFISSLDDPDVTRYISHQYSNYIVISLKR